MNLIHLDPHIFMHAAALVSFTALGLKDQLKLRTVLLVSIVLSLIYHFDQQPGPAWDEIFWNIVTFGITLAVLIQLILDRTHFGLSAEEEALFASLDSITPGEFRALLKVGAWKTAETRSEITVEGVVPQHLFYVLDGHINIEKAGRQMAIGPKTFIGEVAFLHRTPASATVSVEPGARYLQWSVAELEKKIGSRRSLRNSVIRLIGMDMALKVARS